MLSRKIELIEATIELHPDYGKKRHIIGASKTKSLVTEVLSSLRGLDRTQDEAHLKETKAEDIGTVYDELQKFIALVPLDGVVEGAVNRICYESEVRTYFAKVKKADKADAFIQATRDLIQYHKAKFEPLILNPTIDFQKNSNDFIKDLYYSILDEIKKSRKLIKITRIDNIDMYTKYRAALNLNSALISKMVIDAVKRIDVFKKPDTEIDKLFLEAKKNPLEISTEDMAKFKDYPQFLAELVSKYLIEFEKSQMTLNHAKLQSAAVRVFDHAGPIVVVQEEGLALNDENEVLKP